MFVNLNIRLVNQFYNFKAAIVLKIIIIGHGGQGVITAARIFAAAAALVENKHVLCIPSFGWERRGGLVRVDLVISEKPILLRSQIRHPDAAVFFDSILANYHLLTNEALGRETICVVNAPEAEEPPVQPGRQVLRLDARRIALSVLRLDMPNTAMLGAMAGAGLVELSSVCQAAAWAFDGLAGELNSHCAALGCQGLRGLKQPRLVGATASRETVVADSTSFNEPGEATRPQIAAGSAERYYLGPCSPVFSECFPGRASLVRPFSQRDKCVACGTCQDYCPTGAINVDDEISGFSVQTDFCKGCGICYNLCPREAISMVPAKAVV